MPMKIYFSLMPVLLLFLGLAGCAGGATTPYIPPDPPTQQELDDLIGRWSGLTESETGLFDQLDLRFYMDSSNVMATVYLNNTYVDDVHVQYDGDRVIFASYSLMGDYGEFDGLIDHVRFTYIGSFYVQVGLSTTEGTFILNKV